MKKTQNKEERKKTQLLRVMRSTIFYMELACVCQFSNCRANRQKFSTAKWMRFDGLVWHITLLLSRGCGTVPTRYGVITCMAERNWRHKYILFTLLNNYADIRMGIIRFLSLCIDRGQVTKQRRGWMRTVVGIFIENHNVPDGMWHFMHCILE